MRASQTFQRTCHTHARAHTHTRIAPNVSAHTPPHSTARLTRGVGWGGMREGSKGVRDGDSSALVVGMPTVEVGRRGRPRRRGPRAPHAYDPTPPACDPVPGRARAYPCRSRHSLAHLRAGPSPSYGSWAGREAWWVGHVPSGPVPPSRTLGRRGVLRPAFDRTSWAEVRRHPETQQARACMTRMICRCRPWKAPQAVRETPVVVRSTGHRERQRVGAREQLTEPPATRRPAPALDSAANDKRLAGLAASPAGSRPRVSPKGTGA